ncbi:MAG: T9SS type A sorting domain-containing protein [Bacteroidetes bacterium]|nr:T9SS type A sorting domain-containing protein [Bacteroidota bacterium]
MPASTDFRPYSLIIEDIDNDSQNELIVGVRMGGRGREVIVASVLGQFDGFASFVIEYNLQGLTGGSLYSVTTGDLDNDGKKEIYALIWNFLSIHIIESTGANNYQLVKSLDTLYKSTGVDYGALDGVIVADVNGDGINEMYIAGTEPDNTIFIITNVTDVANLKADDIKILMRLPRQAGGKLRTMQIFDMDNDGKLSLMIAGETNGQIFDIEYKGSGNPTLAENWDVNVAFDLFQHSGFSPTATPTINPRLFYGSPARDMDGDGKNEYIVVNYRTSFPVWADDGYLWMIEWKTATNVDDAIALHPGNFSLGQNYPNPFNPETRIQYSVASLPDGKAGSQHVTLRVYDILGREIATLVDEVKEVGVYNSTFSTLNSTLSTGTYFYQLRAGNFIETKKMMYIK